ncbi:MAG TPA: hypothetical protein VJ327_02860 [Patescibacteria group bacterium]|nr:hypothetical protein [Patescibacteria group bacterium]
MVRTLTARFIYFGGGVVVGEKTYVGTNTTSRGGGHKTEVAKVCQGGELSEDRGRIQTRLPICWTSFGKMHSMRVIENIVPEETLDTRGGECCLISERQPSSGNRNQSVGAQIPLRLD